MEYYKYEEVIVIPPKEYYTQFKTVTKDFRQTKEFMFTRIRKGKEKTKDLKQLIKKLEWNGIQLFAKKTIIGASIFDILEHVYKIDRYETNRFEIVRERLITE